MSKLSIRVVRAMPSERYHGEKGGPALFQTVNEYGIRDKGIHVHRKEADKLQQEFDEDTDPVRVYVCLDGIPVYAGMQWMKPDMVLDRAA